MSEAPAGRSTRPVLMLMALAYAALTVLTTTLWLADVGGWLLLPFDLFNFWWPLPAFALLAVAIRRANRRAALFLLLPVLVWTWVHGSLFLPRGDAPTSDLVVLSLNVMVGTETTNQLSELVDEHAPDVVLLQEIFPVRMERIQADLGDRFPYMHAFDAEAVGGVAILSKRPIDRIVDVPKPHERARGTFVATIDGVQYVPVHLTSPCPACGDSLVGRLAGEDAARRLEMQAVLAALDPEQPAVVGGDFNSTDRGDPYRLLADAGFRDPHRERGWGPGFTWSTTLPIEIVRIDWILVRGLEPTGSVLGPTGVSDHRPIIARLAFAG